MWDGGVGERRTTDCFDDAGEHGVGMGCFVVWGELSRDFSF